MAAFASTFAAQRQRFPKVALASGRAHIASPDGRQAGESGRLGLAVGRNGRRAGLEASRYWRYFKGRGASGSKPATARIAAGRWTVSAGAGLVAS